MNTFVLTVPDPSDWSKLHVYLDQLADQLGDRHNSKAPEREIDDVKNHLRQVAIALRTNPPH